MTKTELIAYVRRLTLASSTDLSDAEIGADLDAALLELGTFARWPWLLAESSFLLVEDEPTYELPSDLSILEELILEGPRGSGLDRTTIQELRDRYGTDFGEGTPFLYYESGATTVNMVPVPDADAAGTLVQVHYFKVPDLSAFTANDTPPFTPAFHALLADKAVQYFWEREERPEVATAYESRFYRRANSMLAYYTARLPSTPWVLGGGRNTGGRTRMPSWWPEGN